MHSHTSRRIGVLVLAIGSSFCNGITAQDQGSKANYDLANKYSRSFLRQFTYDSSVRPSWIGKSDRFWYSYRTSKGTRYWLVDPTKKTKTPLFDHAKVAAAITEATEKAVDAT